jgi:hypothetical protein
VVGIFPSREAIIRLVGAVLAEQDDEWTEGCRYMGLEILTACRKTGKDADTNETEMTIEAIGASIEIDREVAISYTTALDVARGHRGGGTRDLRHSVAGSSKEAWL